MDVTNVCLADDCEVVRYGLRSLLERESGFRVVGESTNGLDTIRLVEVLKPDILLVDLMANGMNGIQVTRWVSKHSPATKVIVFSIYENETYVREALSAGAKAYITKRSVLEELPYAMHQVLAGHHYLSANLSELAIDRYLRKTEPSVADPYDALTNREREVLHLMSRGYTTTKIAKVLYISQRTAQAHRFKVMRKLGLRTHTDVIYHAIQHGILPVSDALPTSSVNTL